MAGWHEAKTSRIESAKQAPSEADLATWCQVCRAPGETPDLIAASRAADSMYVEWRRVHRTGMRRTQESSVPLYERTRVFKVSCSTVIPGFLQTPGYAGALMSAITAFQGTPDDVEEAVRARMNRNRLLHAAGHQFTMLVEESVLLPARRLRGYGCPAWPSAERHRVSRRVPGRDPVLRARTAHVDAGSVHCLR